MQRCRATGFPYFNTMRTYTVTQVNHQKPEEKCIIDKNFPCAKIGIYVAIFVLQKWNREVLLLCDFPLKDIPIKTHNLNCVSISWQHLLLVSYHLEIAINYFLGNAAGKCSYGEWCTLSQHDKWVSVFRIGGEVP